MKVPYEIAVELLTNSKLTNKERSAEFKKLEDWLILNNNTLNRDSITNVSITDRPKGKSIGQGITEIKDPTGKLRYRYIQIENTTKYVKYILYLPKESEI